jgi:hypothetical protein
MNSTNEIYIQMNDLNLNESNESNLNDLNLNESNESNLNEIYIEINDICCICLDESEKLDFILDCCHNQIHSKCLEAWYTYDNYTSCPLCRYSYPKNEEIESQQEIDQRRIKPLIYLFVYIMICIILRYSK